MIAIKATLWIAIFTFRALGDASHGRLGPHSWFRPKYSRKLANGKLGEYPARTYISDESIVSPQINWYHWDPACDDGSYYFIAPRGEDVSTPTPMILDYAGNLVWSQFYDNEFGGQAYNFRKQIYRGEEYLTFWLGDDSVRGHGAGLNYMLNASYDIVHTVDAADGFSADLHEFQITPQGTALLSVYDVLPFDITGLVGYEEPEEHLDATYIWDGLIQEVDVQTGKLLFQWRASDHIDVKETYRLAVDGTEEDPFDWFHINSIDKDERGNYLISARYTQSLTYIDGKTGQIIWTLGGIRNDFMDLDNGGALDFAWQHDARFVPADAFPEIYEQPIPRQGYSSCLLTVFDNAAQNGDYAYGPSAARGMLVEVTWPSKRSRQSHAHAVPFTLEEVEDESADRNAMKLSRINGTDPAYTARLIQSYSSPEGLRASSQGSFQYIPATDDHDSNFFAGFGVNAIWAEYAVDGTLLCDAHFSANSAFERGSVQSYRSFKFDWIGMPRTPPAIALNDDEDVVYASWNGATEVAGWLLQCADIADEAEHEERDDDNLMWEDVVSVVKHDFETAIIVPEEVVGARLIRVVALDDDGHVLPFGESEALMRGLSVSYYDLVVDSMSPSGMVLLVLCSFAGMSVVWILYKKLGYDRSSKRIWRGRSAWFGRRQGYQLLRSTS